MIVIRRLLRELILKMYSMYGGIQLEEVVPQHYKYDYHELKS